MEEKCSTIADAIIRWEKSHKDIRIEYVISISFAGQWWPITRLDEDLSIIKHCEGLILDSNRLEKFECMKELLNLTYLSVEMNRLKSLEGLQPLRDTLRVLLVGCNVIRSTKGIEGFQALEAFHIQNNKLDSWDEFDRLKSCPKLVNVSMKGNKFNNNLQTNVWAFLAARRYPKLEIIENIKINELLPQGFSYWTKQDHFVLDNEFIEAEDSEMLLPTVMVDEEYLSNEEDEPIYYDDHFRFTLPDLDSDNEIDDYY